MQRGCSTIPFQSFLAVSGRFPSFSLFFYLISIPPDSLALTVALQFCIMYPLVSSTFLTLAFWLPYPHRILAPLCVLQMHHVKECRRSGRNGMTISERLDLLDLSIIFLVFHSLSRLSPLASLSITGARQLRTITSFPLIASASPFSLPFFFLFVLWQRRSTLSCSCATPAQYASVTVLGLFLHFY